MNDFSKRFHEALDDLHYMRGADKRPEFCIVGEQEWRGFHELCNTVEMRKISPEEIAKMTHKNPMYEGIQLIRSYQDSIIKFVL